MFDNTCRGTDIYLCKVQPSAFDDSTSGSCIYVEEPKIKGGCSKKLLMLMRVNMGAVGLLHSNGLNE